MNFVELLAPAGDRECLNAAVRGGADAVYLGLSQFNARRNAKNFTLEELAAACDYAHLRGCSVYLTLNIIIFEDEVKAALDLINEASVCGVDGFIVQDVGIAYAIAHNVPDVRLHLSTQMNIINKAGVRAAARMGARRVTLGRELSLDEITVLANEARRLGMEVETFAHGALCVCYSGQCLMSSMIGGRSANRGMCAQVCRLPYRLESPSSEEGAQSLGDHLLSPKDLCTIDLLPELVKTGVASLKLEGRMKSPEYVYQVTSAYRKALDRVLAGGSSNVQPRERQGLEEAFSRGFTEGYLVGTRDNSLMSYKRPNNRGVFIGRVCGVNNEKVTLTTSRALHVGDVLQFYTKSGNVTAHVSAPEQPTSSSSTVDLGSEAYKVRKGDRVFRVRNGAIAYTEAPFEPRVGVVGSVALKLNQPLQMVFKPDVRRFEKSDIQHGESIQNETTRAIARRLSTRWKDNLPQGVFRGEAVEKARTKALSREEVFAHVDRMGQTPFALSNLTIAMDDNVGLGFSTLHKARTKALNNLEEEMLDPWKHRAVVSWKKRPKHSCPPKQEVQLAAFVINPAHARVARLAGIQRIYVAPFKDVQTLARGLGSHKLLLEDLGYPEGCIPFVETIDHDAVGSSREARTNADPWAFVRRDRGVLVDSISALEQAHEMRALVEVGTHLPLVNQLSLEVVATYKAQRVWLSPELTLSQIESLGALSNVTLGITIMGAQELMVTEHCLLMSEGTCDQRCFHCSRRKHPHHLKDQKGYEFPLLTDCMGRSHLYNSVPLDIVAHLPVLIDAGVTTFMVDTTLMTPDEAKEAFERALLALRAATTNRQSVAKKPHTTTGHLFRGVA